MCEPTVLTAASLAITTGSAIAEHVSQNRNAKANKTAALAAEDVQLDDISARMREEKLAFAQQRDLVSRESVVAAAMGRVSAAEAGVKGPSMDLLLGDIDASRGRALSSIKLNETVTLDQLERSKAGVRADTRNRINAAPRPSFLNTGLRIGGGVLDYATTKVARKAPIE